MTPPPQTPTIRFLTIILIDNIFSDFSYSSWLSINNFSPTDILSYGSMSKLIETLGLQKYMKKEACSTKEGLYKNPYQGWTSGTCIISGGISLGIFRMQFFVQYFYIRFVNITW